MLYEFGYVYPFFIKQCIIEILYEKNFIVFLVIKMQQMTQKNLLWCSEIMWKYNEIAQ